MYSNSFLQLSDFPNYARQILYESISIQYLLLSSVSDPVFFRIRNIAFKYDVVKILLVQKRTMVS